MANIQETKVLLGRMDKTNSPETVAQYDYTDAWNIRTVGNEEGDANYVTNLEGTLKVTAEMPEGDTRGIGGARFESVSKGYYVRYNSLGRHQIVELDYLTATESVVFENITDTAGNQDILNWEEDVFFPDIRLLHERYLILNNSQDNIYYVDTEYFKQNRGSIQFTTDDITLAVKPPLAPAETQYVNNLSKTTNALKGDLFQFRYQYIYRDYRQSAWSTVSKRPVPINEPAKGQGQSLGVANGMVIKLDTGGERVVGINLAVRIGLGNWLLVKTLDRDKIAEVEHTTIPITNNGDLGYEPPIPNPPIPITEAYNPLTEEYSFVFYNDGLYPVLDQVEVENPYDAVPNLAETVEIINGNLLSIGGVTEGYDRPEIEDVKLSVLEYDPNITSTTPVGGGDFDFDRYYEDGRQSEAPGVYSWYRNWVFKGTPEAGDIIRIKIRNKGTLIFQEYSYTVTASDETGGRATTMHNARLSLVSQSLPAFPYIGTSLANDDANHMWSTRQLWDNNNIYYDIEFIVSRQSIGTISTQSINILKSNSSYQVALAYFDKYGKYFPLVTDDRFIVNTLPKTETGSNLSQINWEIQEDAPEGAVSYQWLLSENQKYQKSLYLTGRYNAADTDDNYISIEMRSLVRFLRNEEDSQINYTFTKGDKAIFLYTTNGADSIPEDRFNNPNIEVDVVDFTIEEDAAVLGGLKYLLKVRKTDLLEQGGSLAYLENKDIMIELYTPKKRDVSIEGMLFYEIGEQFDIVDGKHVVTSGTIRNGDWYYRGRLYESNINQSTAITYEVEDPNFSDNYESAYWSAGRGRTYNDELGKVFRQASIRYSDEYVNGTKYNGISRFYLERIYGEEGGQTTSKYGTIARLEMRDNALVCIQEFKVGIIPIYRSIIYDNADTSIVADSGKIFGSVQYRVGNYGSGNAKKSISVSRNSVIYFIDSNNCVPVRDSYSGLDVIDVNMKHYFIDHIRKTKEGGGDFIGYFDDYYGEYNVSTTGTDTNTTITWSEDRKGWITFKSFTPDCGFSMYTNLFTVKNGEAWIHTTKGATPNNFYGQQLHSTIKFPVSSQGVKTYHSIAVHSNKPVGTTEDGVVTQLGNITDLITQDFSNREGVYYANFLRDVIMDDKIKGRYIEIELTDDETKEQKLELFKIVLKSNISTPNE